MINGGGGQHDAGTAVIRAWAAQDSYQDAGMKGMCRY